MNIHFITGGSGFVGKYLTEALLTKGETVWVLLRPSKTNSVAERARAVFGTFLEQYPDTFRYVEGDILRTDFGLTKDQLDELMKKTIILWHLAADLSFSKIRRNLVNKTNYDGTVNAVVFANRYAVRFVYMSTAYVCGDEKTFTEEELVKGQRFRNTYELSKYRAELYVREHCQSNYVIFRPSVIIGDMYQGKAEGCTFGYYRYAFMFHFLKKKLVLALKTRSFGSWLLRRMGTHYDAKTDTVSVSWLPIPYPKNGLVDLVTVDYVVSVMVELYDQAIDTKTVHVTSKDRIRHQFVLEAILYDLGLRDVRLVAIPPRLFALLAKVLFFVVYPVRKYVRHVMWYIPYITISCTFDRSTVQHFNIESPPISREQLRRINVYAKENILDRIEV